ncbi:MAG: nucleoside hydrolase [Brevefilum sp.]|nr:nucleoside hydrolase [Brevefilum sp.]
MTQKIIFDCDNTLGIPLKEVDDGLTLLYLLGVPELDLLGITTTFGNGRIDQVYPQTSKLVNHLDLNVPVLKGEGQPGQTPDTPAARFLVETANQYPGEIKLLATGPLGNLHAASNLDPDFFQKLKAIHLMGGYLEPVKLGYRNLQELNLSANPIAANTVLNAHCPVTVFSAQACLDAPYRFKDIRNADYWPRSLKWTIFQWLLAFGLFTGKFVFYLWDLLPAVYLTQPELFNIKDFSIEPSIKDLQSGMLIEGDSSKNPVIKLAMGIQDQQAFYNHLNNAWRDSAKRYSL